MIGRRPGCRVESHGTWKVILAEKTQLVDSIGTIIGTPVNQSNISGNPKNPHCPRELAEIQASSRFGFG
jgi:hypothetical protein